MARAATVPLVRNATLYAWLADRERGAVAAGGTLPQGDGTPCWDGSRERLAALQRGEAVDLPL
jgi:hypothetical protein